MLRTSFYLPDALHQQLLLRARHERKSFSRLISDLLDSALAVTRHDHVRRVFDGLSELDGIGPKGITDVATTINQVLYGAQSN